MTAPARRAGHCDWRIALVLVALLTMTAALAVGAPAQATAAQSAPHVEISLVDQTTWHTRAETFTAEVRVDNPPADATIRLIVHDRLVSRTAFQASLEGTLGRTIHESPAQPLETMPRTIAGGVRVEVPVGSDGAELSDPGLYPVEVAVADADGTTLETLTTHLTVLPAPGVYPSLSVAVVVDVSSPPTLQPDGSTTLSPETIDRTEERAELLAHAGGVAATLAPRPETLDGLADDARGAEIIDSLARWRQTVLARPYTEIDLAALADAALLREANHHAELGADVIRDRFGSEPSGGIWLGGETVGPEAARLLVDLGIDRTVVPPSAISELGSGIEVPTTPVRLGPGGPTTMVSDPVVADRMASGGTLGAQHAVSELAMIWFDTPAVPRGVVVHLRPNAQIDPDAIARALRVLDSSHAVDVAPLGELFDLPPRKAEYPVGTPTTHRPASLRDVAGQVDEARMKVNGYASALGDISSGHTLNGSLLLATGATTPEEQRPSYVNRVTATLAALADAIHAPAEFRITLTSRSSTIPLTITNDTIAPIEVRVRLESSRLEFPDGDVITTTLPPGATRLEVAVETRTSGAFPLDITITSPDGAIELDHTTFDIRSTAVSGVGLILSIGTGLFLLLWWGRHWRTTRRARRTDPSGETDDVASDDVPVAATAEGSTESPENGYRPTHMAPTGPPLPWRRRPPH